MSGAESRSRTRSTTSTPPGQCASPVPETVIATRLTPGALSRNASATRSSGATSVSKRIFRAAGVATDGAGRVVAPGSVVAGAVPGVAVAAGPDGTAPVGAAFEQPVSARP